MKNGTDSYFNIYLTDPENLTVFKFSKKSNDNVKKGLICPKSSDDLIKALKFNII